MNILNSSLPICSLGFIIMCGPNIIYLYCICMMEIVYVQLCATVHLFPKSYSVTSYC